MIRFKHEDHQSHFLYISPKLGEVMLDAHHFLQDKGYDMTVTSMVRESGDGISASQTHQTGRAFDFSVRGIPDEVIAELIEVFNKKYYNVAAYSRSKNMPTLMLRHDSGQGDHVHVQIHPRYIYIYAQNIFKP